jgi:sodium transport system permease protein
LYHAPPAAGAPAVEPAIAAAIVMAAMATYLVIAVVVPHGLVLPAAQAALAAIPIAAIAYAQRGYRLGSPWRLLGFGRAHPRFFIAAIAIGTTAWYLNMRLVAGLPLPDHQTRVLAELVSRPTLVGALALFAVMPAVCEEILFRGVLARSLGKSLPLAVAAGISAVVFSAYHLSLVQALPTLTLGLLLGLVAIRADSVLPSIAAHALNNTLAIAMSRNALPTLAGGLEGHPTLALAGSVTATAAGLALVLWRPPARSPEGEITT